MFILIGEHFTNLEYDTVKSLTAEEFAARTRPREDLLDKGRFVPSDEEDYRKIERLLDVKEGTLPRGDFFFEKYTSECGRTLTMYDFVLTALVDAKHSKSFILHTLVGSKRVANKPRITRCSECARNSTRALEYSMSVNAYACSVG